MYPLLITAAGLVTLSALAPWSPFFSDLLTHLTSWEVLRLLLFVASVSFLFRLTHLPDKPAETKVAPDLQKRLAELEQKMSNMAVAVGLRHRGIN